MNDILRKAYAIHDYDSSKNNNYNGENSHSKYHYFIITLQDLEPFHLEEISLAHYLRQMGENKIAEPIRNTHGNWFTFYRGEQIVVFRHEAIAHQRLIDESLHGNHLATFHEKHRSYPTQFEYIYSYGSWQQLWLNRLSYYENKIEQLARNSQPSEPNPYIELFPYMLSLTENAVQYINEAEKENRISKLDTPTVTFKRYEAQILDETILPTELIIDHPMRDVAESLRHLLLYEESEIPIKVRNFLAGYEKIEPLSLRSWRLVYGRLLYPAHYFDLLDFYLKKKKNFDRNSFSLFIKRQTRYEDRLAKLFTYVGIEPYINHIPMVSWLLY